MSEVSTPHSMEEDMLTVRTAVDVAGYHSLTDREAQAVLDAPEALTRLFEQFDASREATQKWYDEAHQQRTAINRALHELDQWVYADGTASYRVERAEAILRAALNPAKRPTDG